MTWTQADCWISVSQASLWLSRALSLSPTDLALILIAFCRRYQQFTALRPSIPPGLHVFSNQACLSCSISGFQSCWTGSVRALTRSFDGASISACWPSRNLEQTWLSSPTVSYTLLTQMITGQSREELGANGCSANQGTF